MKQRSITRPEFPMGTELLYMFCNNDPDKFQVLCEYLGRAFNDGANNRPLKRYRHKKRGTEYLLVGVAKFQAGELWRVLKPGQELPDGGEVGSPADMREVVVYLSLEDWSYWVRPREEFEDGRFEEV